MSDQTNVVPLYDALSNARGMLGLALNHLDDALDKMHSSIEEIDARAELVHREQDEADRAYTAVLYRRNVVADIFGVDSRSE